MPASTDPVTGDSIPAGLKLTLADRTEPALYKRKIPELGGDVIHVESPEGPIKPLALQFGNRPPRFVMDVSAVADPIPEPSTWALMVAGAAAILIRRRLARSVRERPGRLR